MSTSILESTKKALGVSEDYHVFDSDILMHINTTFSTLTQLGLGPAEGFSIEDVDATWDTLLRGDARLNNVKTYVYLKVRLLFDPPTTSYLLQAIQDQIKELEWRINTAQETRSTLLLGERKKITGHLGDEYNIRLANPAGKTLINATGTYQAEFIPSNGRTLRSVTLDTSQRASGILFLPVIIENGVFNIFSLNPRRTILTLETTAR